MAEPTADELSAYIDEELGPDERARVERWLAASSEARAQLDRLVAARDEVPSAAMDPTGAEARAMDAVVPVPVRPASPRKRGRPPWPYFAAAASIAVVLSLGIVVLAQITGRDTSSKTPSNTAAATRSDTAPDRTARSEVPSEVPDDAGGPGPPAREPELYLSGLEVADPAGLSTLAGRSPAPTWTRSDGIAYLVGLGEGAGIDRTELGTCLAAAGPAVPARVDVGTFAGTPAFLVALAEPGTPGVTVAAIARGSCTLLADVAVGP